MTRKRNNDNKMSRQPPLPPGLPPRPSGPAHPYGGDSYRPQSENYYRQEPQQIYEFRGAPDTSYRPSYDQRSRSPPRYSNYPPGIPPPRYTASDSYHPRDPPNDFTFRYDAPSSIDFRQAASRQRSSPGQRVHHQESSIRHRQDNYGNNNRSTTRGGYRGRSGPRMASDREFLKGNRAPTPELMPGMDDDQANAVRYMPIEDLSDSDEAEMDLSDEEGTEKVQQPKKKQARIETSAADGDSVPKWSNPDPYTTLPPPDESQRKKKDVVKLIRKARLTATSENTTKTEAVADDFISFDFDNVVDDDQDDDKMLGQKPVNGVVGAPTGPRFRDNAHKQGQQSGSLNQVLNQQERAFRPALQRQSNDHQSASSREDHSRNGDSKMQDSLSGPVSQSRANQQRQVTSQLGNDYKQQQSPTPSTKPVNADVPQTKLPNKPAAEVIDLTSDPALGNRKRTIRDEIKGPLKSPPLIHESSRGKKPPVNGEILKAWRVKDGFSPTPWLSIDHSDSANMGVWLHKEIVDFYHFVKPRNFEQFIRTKVVEELRNNVQKSFQKHADIRTFGSFPAGLYLPISDMDIVYVSDNFMRGGNSQFGRNQMFRFDHFLKTCNLALNGETEVVSKAKVPLVKYVDRITGLKIDISFENDTGLIANRTFQEWKATFPAMPILVTLIKHLLAMRGLNEPVNGGIGGFSVTCLVVSLLQNMPQVQSGSMIPEHHLGEILMEFLDLYGNQFDTRTTAIQLNPPGYIPKSHANIPYKNEEKFAIIDPNRRDNDIAGGSKNTRTILRCFSDSYNQLQKRMGELQYSANRRSQSILACILGGNYTSFKLQREHLAHVHENLYGSIESPQ